MISQHPATSASAKKLDDCTISSAAFKSLCAEVQSLKQSMDVYNNKMSALEGKVTCVLDKCVEMVEKITAVESVLTEGWCLKKSSAEAISSSASVHSAEARSVLFNTKLATRPPSQGSCAQEGGRPTLTQHQLDASESETVSAADVGPRVETTSARILTESSQIIKLNEEADYPDGSWLGNPAMSEARVRVPLRSFEVDHINISCSTPEKMALVLLDQLFTRETLAESNLTGKGRHKKKQLDPLLVFGIYCHLQYMFSIDEADWVRIKNNMEAKCRFLWTRKSKGLPLGSATSIKAGDRTTSPAEYTVELVSDPSYAALAATYSQPTIYSCAETQEASSVYCHQLEAGCSQLDLGSCEQLLVHPQLPVLVTSKCGTSLMCSAGEEEEDDPV